MQPARFEGVHAQRIGMMDESKTGASIAGGPNRGVGPEKKIEPRPIRHQHPIHTDVHRRLEDSRLQMSDSECQTKNSSALYIPTFCVLNPEPNSAKPDSPAHNNKSFVIHNCR